MCIRDSILDIPDLSAEGTFTFGLAVSAALTAAGHPLAGVLLGFLAGSLGGAVTGVLQTKLRIHPILAGILTMSGLYSVNLAVMGSSSCLLYTSCLEPAAQPTIEDVREAFHAAAHSPIGGAPLEQLVSSEDLVTIVISDVTRFWSRQDLVCRELVAFLHEECGVLHQNMTCLLYTSRNTAVGCAQAG